MTKQEFKPIWDRMCKYYGRENMDQLAETYFNEMKYITKGYEQFERELYKNYTYFPKITEIKQTRYFLFKDEKTATKCPKCNGTGLVIVQQKENDRVYDYALACYCDNGADKVYDGRTIEDVRYRTNYMITRLSQDISIK